MSFRNLLREPLFHFLLAGAGLFLIYRLVAGPETAGEDEILVSFGQIEHMVSIFEKTRQRPPTLGELDGLIDAFVEEEVLARVAISMGLDQDDTIIRRRLKQKMDFLLDDFTGVRASDEQLLEFLENNPGSFQTKARISFSQVFFRDVSEVDLNTVLADLEAGLLEAGSVGDATLLPVNLDMVRGTEVSSQFGELFTQAVFDISPGQWRGPVESAYGLHLVKVYNMEPASMPGLDEIREIVQREWLVEYRKTAQQKMIDQLKKQYRIVIESSAAEPQ